MSAAISPEAVSGGRGTTIGDYCSIARRAVVLSFAPESEPIKCAP